MRAAVYAPSSRRRTLLDADTAARLDWILIGAVVVDRAARSRDDLLGIARDRRGRSLLLREAPGASRSASRSIVFIGLLKIDYRKLRDFSLVAYLVTVAAPVPRAHAVRFERQGCPVVVSSSRSGSSSSRRRSRSSALIVALAGYVNEHRGDIDPWRLTVIIGLALVPLALVQLQPDLGTNMVLICIVLGLLAVGGVKGRYLGVIALLGITGDLRGDQPRDPEAVPARPAHDSVRVVVEQAPPGRRVQPGPVGQDDRHRWTRPAQGLFKGPQTRLGFVPEQQTDFIFTAVGEELGFVGAAVLLAAVRDRAVAHLANRPARARLLRHSRVRWRPGDVHVHDLREHRHDDGDHAGHRASRCRS